MQEQVQLTRGGDNRNLSRLVTYLLLALAAVGCRAPESHPVVGLFSDFGLQNDAVGVMRGVILSHAPRATLADVCHEVVPFDVADGARLLAEAPAVFPAGTVFCVVVDPGVGTARRAIVARLPNGSLLVAPDNGVLTDTLARLGPAEVRQVTNPPFLPTHLSATFHGRDLFAPVAGRLAGASDPQLAFTQLGPVVTDWIRLSHQQAEREEGALSGRVTTIDEPFGNVWSNVPGEWLSEAGFQPGQPVQVQVGGHDVTVPWVATFGNVAPGEALLYVNSRGFASLALNTANFAKAYGIERGAPLVLRPSE